MDLKAFQIFFACVIGVVATTLMPVHAQSQGLDQVLIQKTSNGELKLQGSCEEVEKSQKALLQWKQKLGELSSADRLSQMEPLESNHQCQLEITKLLPKFVRENLGSRKWAGPNCWNTVLLANKLISAKRFSVANEFASWMNSPLCQRVPNENPTTAGAIVAVRDRQNRDHHAFVSLGKTLAFEKIGPAASEEYRLVSPETALGPYKSKLASGDLHLETFECLPLNPYLSSNENMLSPALLELLKNIRTFSDALGPWTHVSQAPGKEQIEAFVLHASKLNEDLDRVEPQSPDALLKDGWFWLTLKTELQSLQTQLKLIHLK